MKLLRLFVGAVLVAVIIALVTQARTISALSAEVAALRKDLRMTLTRALADAPAPVSDAERAEREKLELIKLRHEVRELREASAAAPGGRKSGGWQGLFSPLLPSSMPTGNAPGKVRPEWKRMESMATNNYAKAMQALNSATNELVRFLSLGRAAKMSLAVGRTEDARKFATDMMTLDDKYSRGDPEKANGDVVHDGNLVLGVIALEEGRMDEAKRHLLAAGKSRGSPVLGSFGPNMILAKELLLKGEQATVLQYFDLCRKFWGSHAEKLDEWTKEVHAGRIPEFGANLIY